MPARRRQARARRGLDPDVFVDGNGYEQGLLSGERLAPDRETAENEWERLRGEAWDRWAEVRAMAAGPRPWPPYAAVAFDGLTRRTADTPYGAAAEIADAVAADLAGVAAFRSRRPAAAAQCAEGLAAFEADLRARAAIAERPLSARRPGPPMTHRGDR